MNCKFKKAFTLAEVLITLAVIGVVAAMTIPVLIQNYKKRVATVRLKKFVSVMEQAIKLSEIDNGPIENWIKEHNEYDDIDDNADDDVKQEALTKDRKAVTIFYKTYLKPYLKTAKEDYNYDADEENKRAIMVYMPDGTTFFMYNGGCTDVHYDINATKEPNVYGKDKFAFLICPSNDYGWGFGNKQNLKPLVSKSESKDSSGNISREKLLKQCKTDAKRCSGLLMYDNFEFKDDYPYKL